MGYTRSDDIIQQNTRNIHIYNRACVCLFDSSHMVLQTDENDMNMLHEVLVIWSKVFIDLSGICC